MPQPFVDRKGEAVINPSVLLGRPALAVQIAVVAARWQHVEGLLAASFTWLLNGHEATALAIYHAFDEPRLRELAFMAAGDGRLPKALMEEARQLFPMVRKGASERNAVVHGTWAILKSRPESLMLVDQKDPNRFQLRAVPEMRLTKRSPTIQAEFALMEYT